MSNKTPYGYLIKRLSELVNEEHVCGCGQDSCDINSSWSNGFEMWAIELFSHSGASSPEFNRLYKKLPKRKFRKEAENDRKCFVDQIAHDQCPNCNAVVWHNWNHGNDYAHCDSCGQDFDLPEKEMENSDE